MSTTIAPLKQIGISPGATSVAIQNGQKTQPLKIIKPWRANLYAVVDACRDKRVLGRGHTRVLGGGHTRVLGGGHTRVLGSGHTRVLGGGHTKKSSISNKGRFF